MITAFLTITVVFVVGLIPLFAAAGFAMIVRRFHG